MCMYVCMCVCVCVRVCVNENQFNLRGESAARGDDRRGRDRGATGARQGRDRVLANRV